MLNLGFSKLLPSFTEFTEQTLPFNSVSLRGPNNSNLFLFIYIADVDANRELTLTQQPSTHPSITSGSCPGTPEMRRRQEEAMRRLAAQV